MSRRMIIVAVLVIACLPLACSKSSAIRDASIDELHDALGKPNTVLLDIRKGDILGSDLVFIEGALQVPMHTLAQNLHIIPKQSNVYIIANDFNNTVKAANILADNGYSFIYRVQEGFDAYVKKYPQKP